MNKQVISFTLTDQVTKKQVGGEINIHKFGISMKFDGYGDSSSQPGFGEPVYIELYNSKLTVWVWPDINQEDPKSISLEGAREEKYVVLSNSRGD